MPERNRRARLPAAGSKGPISLQEFQGQENLADLSPQRRFVAIEALERSVVDSAQRKKARGHLVVDPSLYGFRVVVGMRGNS